MNNLIVLVGPTGVGKTDIAVDLASEMKCEIISADSRQFFREMKIGTAVPSDHHLIKVRHHFIRFIPVDTYYSSSLFERDVLDLLHGLFLKNNRALMAGGSGMYIDAVCHGTDDIPDVDQEIRNKYIAMYHESGIEGLRTALKLLDPEHYSKVDLKNYKRIIRALEICESTGRPYSSFLLKQKRARDFRIIKIGLERNREDLYTRINSRVDKMIQEGLEDEARELYGYKNMNALNSVGYREFFDFFEGKISKDKAIELIKRNSRRYAKRQITWWAKDDDIHWFHPDEKDEITRFVKESVSGKIL
ncbi:MAG: tRNA (adenosine(37)-N6)-dimethylallyltransferase MiaA [Bacteroidetes bacterium GWE2_41_25]|nr:MAG: tRNA (adenosine(37)-N6)-dimethylallyltransferase MiaA [Bacteroidetes bacterium GWA2_40_15]OFX86137.1 MAG: tRNA (adenosine(37)-N6)-dimethylallyltransferase MiaA [Bacteroidetes bacterium GWC2_40_22]OFX91048.1 MAG: tRNA (adenosine(37)-N6)-dimethylallyltransferase MiaA [Bacteroidetes bacterium GWE2_41_25]OFY61731.1 MAG: tRNA (adenosine(37)-N6)-dimethylallyltransferase MiaA [Bacteroidetes bacterium GWF2_41_9]HAM09018.1 tRNA (adenosine(37)-N6)-dimethylallyltransferase MiaA [Bacteroidales bact